MSLQLKFQKIITVFGLLTGVLFFVLGLGYSTNLYTLYYFIDPTSFMYVEGSRIYYDVQDFNRAEVLYAVVMLLISGFCFMTLNNKRRKYYISNYISSAIYVIFDGFLSYYVYTNTVLHKEQFLTTVDFEGWQMWVDMFPNDFTMNTSTFWFDAAMVVSAVGILAALLTIANVIWKTVWMSREKKAMLAFAAEKEAR